MSTATYAHIEADAAGVPVISGTTMKVVELVAEHLAWGWDAVQLQRQHPYLTMGQVRSALAYFHDHEQELRDEIERRHRQAEAIRKELGNSRASGNLAQLLRAR
jgi:uncharacterized protein (DUF433 family)